MDKIRNWFKNEVKKSQWIHVNQNSRIKFRRIYLLSALSIFLIYILSIVFFYLYGLRFNPNAAIPYSSGTKTLFLALGIIIFIVASILAILFLAIYFPLLFNNSKVLYTQSDEFKQQVLKYSEADLSKYDKKELKWLWKLGWISKIQYQQNLMKLKTQKHNAKDKSLKE